MARRAQPRHRSGPNKGRFKKRGTATRSRKRNPPRKARGTAVARRRTTTRAKASRARPRARAPRRNPPRFSIRGVTKQLTDGAMDATLVLAGKAATRTIPLAANLPKGGNLGLAVQALTAVVVAMVAQRVLSPARARMVLAGGLSAPVETLIVSYKVPFLAPALQPVEADAQLSAYGLGGYVTTPIEQLAGYVQDPGLGQYYGEPAFA